jgi:protein-tyrosine phosphatase
MKIDRIMVVCDGNICRSPTAAAMLRQRLDAEKTVTSAGLVALEGHDMDATARAVAQDRGLDCGPHEGRVLTRELCGEADLILVMERHQRERLGKQFPEALGKTMLLGHWLDNREIPDPYRRGRDVFEQVFDMLEEAATTWADRIE